MYSCNTHIHITYVHAYRHTCMHVHICTELHACMQQTCVQTSVFVTNFNNIHDTRALLCIFYQLDQTRQWHSIVTQPHMTHNIAVIYSVDWPFWLFLDFVFLVVFSLTDGHFSALTRTSQGSRKLLLCNSPGWSRPQHTIIYIIHSSQCNHSGMYVGFW